MSKTLQKKVHQYTALFEPEKSGSGYTVTIPSLPGCISEGDTFEEALKNIQEAASLYVEVMRDEKKKIVVERRSIIVVPVQVVA